MDKLSQYYRNREKKNEELVMTMAYAIVIGFGLLCLYALGKLIIGAIATSAT